jgi:ceramide glucosyltransferase
VLGAPDISGARAAEGSERDDGAHIARNRWVRPANGSAVRGAHLTVHLGATWLGILLSAAAAAYAIAVLVADLPRRRSWPAAEDGATPPVTILKPLCGAEPGLYENLRSFCNQTYPRFQIVFGVADSADPAVDVVQRLRREFTDVDIQLAINRRQHGSSRKVSNLINMMPFARHDYLIIADSDVRVTPSYLRQIVPPLLHAGVGIVTCAYRGKPRQGLWSLFGSLFINDWFIPSVRVAAMLGSSAFAFGATIAIRRETLAAIGGFHSMANQLADDYRLGELTRRLGLRTVLADVVVETCVDEGGLGTLVSHELRWLRTIRAVRPVGFSLLFVTFGFPLAALGTVLARGAWPAAGLSAITCVARAALYWRASTSSAASGSVLRLFVLPLRDLLSVALWGWSFTSSRVYWRGFQFRILRDGSVLPVARRTVQHQARIPAATGKVDGALGGFGTADRTRRRRSANRRRREPFPGRR